MNKTELMHLESCISTHFRSRSLDDVKKVLELDLTTKCQIKFREIILFT